MSYEIGKIKVRRPPQFYEFSDLTAWSGDFPDLLSASKGIPIGPTTLTDPVGAVRLFKSNHPSIPSREEGEV